LLKLITYGGNKMKWKIFGILFCMLLLSTISATTSADMELSDDDNKIGIPGDVNGDGLVNIDDIFFILGHWGEPGGPADANEDGTVNIDDIFFVLGHWT
jgi:hypothetical protein